MVLSSHLAASPSTGSASSSSCTSSLLSLPPHQELETYQPTLEHMLRLCERACSRGSAACRPLKQRLSLLHLKMEQKKRAFSELRELIGLGDVLRREELGELHRARRQREYSLAALRGELHDSRVAMKAAREVRAHAMGRLAGELGYSLLDMDLNKDEEGAPQAAMTKVEAHSCLPPHPSHNPLSLTHPTTMP